MQPIVRGSEIYPATLLTSDNSRDSNVMITSTTTTAVVVELPQTSEDDQRSARAAR